MRGKKFEISESALRDTNNLSGNGCQEVLHKIAQDSIPVTIEDVRKSIDGDEVYAIRLPDSRIFIGFTANSLKKLETSYFLTSKKEPSSVLKVIS